MRISLCLFATLCLMMQSATSEAQPDQNQSVCRSLDPRNGLTGFVVSVSQDKVIQSESYAQKVAGNSFVVCIPIASGHDTSVGAVNIRIQVYRPSEPVDYVKFEGDSQAYRGRIQALQRRSGQKYPTISIQRYQNYHGCGDLTSTDNDLDRYFHTQDELGRRTNATVEQRQRFLFLYDISPSCGWGSPVVAYGEGIGELLIPSIQAGNFGIASRHSGLAQIRFPAQCRPDKLRHLECDTHPPPDRRMSAISSEPCVRGGFDFAGDRVRVRKSDQGLNGRCRRCPPSWSFRCVAMAISA